MNKLPLARSTDIVVQELEGEVFIYDLVTNKAFNLNKTSSIVFRACDGKTTFAELKTGHKFSDDLIFLALDELAKENLIDADSSYVSPFAGMSRREVIRKVGFASMIALPVISSLIAPTAAMAGSGCAASTNRANGCACSANSQCGTNCCKSNGNAQQGQFTCVNSGGGNQCVVTCPSISPCNNAVTIPTGCPCTLSCSNCAGACDTTLGRCV